MMASQILKRFKSSDIERIKCFSSIEIFLEHKKNHDLWTLDNSVWMYNCWKPCWCDKWQAHVVIYTYSKRHQLSKMERKLFNGLHMNRWRSTPYKHSTCFSAWSSIFIAILLIHWWEHDWQADASDERDQDTAWFKASIDRVWHKNISHQFHQKRIFFSFLELFDTTHQKLPSSCHSTHSNMNRPARHET
jgi:hypothetical protein